MSSPHTYEAIFTGSVIYGGELLNSVAVHDSPTLLLLLLLLVNHTISAITIHTNITPAAIRGPDDDFVPPVLVRGTGGG